MQGQAEQQLRPLRDLLPPEPFGAAEARRPPGYGMQRLQPVMLGPPPGAIAGAVSAADDIDPQELSGRPRTGLAAGVVAVIAVGATVAAAWWTLAPKDEHMDLPPQAAQPAPQHDTAAPAPVSAVSEPAVDMARIDSDLVPPATDGLSPARRVPTIRIVVENDREVAAPR